MRWNHLPMAGGLFDQNPMLLERFYYILTERSKWEAEERKREQDKSHSVPNKRSGRGRRRR